MELPRSWRAERVHGVKVMVSAMVMDIVNKVEDVAVVENILDSLLVDSNKEGEIGLVWRQLDINPALQES